VAKWDADHDRLVQVHREDTFNRLRYFYNVVRELYAGTSTHTHTTRTLCFMSEAVDQLARSDVGHCVTPCGG
jgi:hypothetical protein